MNIGLSTTFQTKSILRSCWQITCCVLLIQGAFAQTITVPSSNDNDTSTRKPFGCFYGYERTHALYTSSEMGSTTGYITHVAFYVNSVSNPAPSTPVVIKMKTTSSSSITASTYDAATTGATMVWSGNVTAAMLSANSWITLQLTIPFNYASNNLEVFVETNFGSDGDELFNAKQFRHSDPGSNRCQFWEDDNIAPTDNGVVTNQRPNIQLTFEEVCSGTPVPGNTLSTNDTVCSGELFTLSMANIGTVPGLTYQWKQKPTGGSYSNINGATNSTHTTSQNNTYYYQCLVTCGASSATSAELQVVLKPFYHCYCESAATDESDTDIDQVAIGTMLNNSDPFACATYTDYTGVTAPTLNPNQPYTLHIENGSCSGIAFQSFVSAYIDFDRDGTFESLEQVYSYGPIDELNSIPDKTFFIPTLAPPGLTGMRIVIIEGDTPPPACGSYTFGETEDYLVNISAVTACSGTPAVTTTLSTDTSVCVNQLFTLSLADYPTATNITYQWQYSYTLSSWQTFVGATGPTYTPPTGQIVPTYYRCVVTCTSTGGGTEESDYVFVDMAPFYACYCTSGATSFADTKIDTVKIGSIVAGSPEEQCETYTDNTSMITDLVIGEATPIHIRNGSCSGEFNDAYVAVYIDYNKDHDFEDPDELVYSFGPITEIDGIQDGSITVGGTVATGTTGMRIVLSEVDTIPGPCGEYPYGETEDYAVNIIILPPCDSPPDPGVATSTLDSLCESAAPANITLNIIDYSSGTGQTYQWESSTDNVSYDPITGTTPTTTALVSESTYYRCLVTCSGNTQPSEPVFVKVNPEPPGNLQSDPIIISSLPYSIINDNLAANCWTSDYTSTLPQASPDAFYQVTIGDTTGVLYISMCNTLGFNSYLHLLDETGQHLNSNDNNGPLCTGNDASIVDTVTSVPFTYYIVVEGSDTDEGIYNLEVSFIPDSTTNIISIGTVFNTSLKIFPNPADGDFTLQLETSTSINEAATVKIYNAIGQIVYTQPVAIVHGKVTEEIKLAQLLPDGMYLVEVIAESGGWNQSLLLQH